MTNNNIGGGATATSTYTPCPHNKGWFDTIHFWIFEREVFCCELCMRILEVKNGEVQND